MYKLIALLALIAGLVVPNVADAQDSGVRITDDRGATVTLAQPARRIILADGLDFLAVSLIDRDPISLVVGWNPAGLDPDLRASIAKREPRIARIANLGSLNGTNFPVEPIVALKPDLILATPYFRPSDEAISRFERAGIAVAVLAISPWPEGERSRWTSGIRRLGQLLGRTREADAYAGFVVTHMSAIRDRIAKVSGLTRPTVLLEAHAPAEGCCVVPGRSRSMADFVTQAGGENLGSAVVSGLGGPVGVEYVIQRRPLVYIGTGGPHMKARGGLVTGIGIAPEAAATSLRAVTDRTGIAQTPAVVTGQAHGMWHPLATSAVNIVGMELIAKWTQPELFADLDPRRTLDEINARFLAYPLEGTLWTDTKTTPLPASHSAEGTTRDLAVPVVGTILLLIVVMGFLLYRRRHH